MKSVEEFYSSKDINIINKFRIKYYLGNIDKEIIVSRKKYMLFDDKIVLDKETCKDTERELKVFFDKYVLSKKYFDSRYTQIICYYKDLDKYLKNYKLDTNRENIEFIFYFGDSVRYKDTPCLTKARSSNGNDYSVLMNLNTIRHTGMLNDIPNMDIPFEKKLNCVLWRGTDTAYNDNDKRSEIVLKYQNCTNENIDIKFSHFVNKRDLSKYKIAKKMSIAEMLKYKFLLSIEGNDVATNLKWILLSKSVVLMAKPGKCSWFMEDMLIPFTHYVPLNDNYDNIEEMYTWCMNNMDKCKEISQNATNYMKVFLDDENEKYVTTEVLKGYFDKVKFVD